MAGADIQPGRDETPADRPAGWRVVHVVRQFWPSIGGLEEVALKLSLKQRQLYGFTPTIVTLDRLFTDRGLRLPRTERVRGLPVIRIPWCGSHRYPIAPGVLRHLQAADIVQVHGIDFFFDFLAWTRPLHRRPLVASTHGGFFHTRSAASLKEAYFKFVTPMSCRRYDAIVASSEADAALFQTVAAANLHTIANGVDTDKFADRASLQHRRSLIYFGRLAPHKRIPTILALLRELRRGEPDWRLTIAGREWGTSNGELRAAAAAAEVADAVEIVSEPRDSELCALIGRSSYFVCGSAYEGFGVAAVEALAAGLIPVLSTIPPFVRLLERAGVGLGWDPDEPHRAAIQLNQFARYAAANPGSLRQRAMEGAAAYAWGAVAEQFTALYRAVNWRDTAAAVHDPARLGRGGWRRGGVATVRAPPAPGAPGKRSRRPYAGAVGNLLQCRALSG
jgi:alpha-1,3-mannosyltransferase